MKKCRCRIEQEVANEADKAGIAEAFRSCSFETFREVNKAAYSAKHLAIRYTENFQSIRGERTNSIALLGEVGSGKTTLGFCIMRKLLKDGVSCKYVPYRSLMLSLKATANDDIEHAKVLARFTKPELLFIDDLFREDPTQADIKHTYDVVNARYLANKPMVITSERDMSSLLDIDGAIGSRIYEMCRSYAFEMRGGQLNFRLR